MGFLEVGEELDEADCDSEDVFGGGDDLFELFAIFGEVFFEVDLSFVEAIVAVFHGDEPGEFGALGVDFIFFGDVLIWVGEELLLISVWMVSAVLPIPITFK